jgi:hypothetical protein
MLSVPVILSGGTAEGRFSEETHTLVINAHGALVELKAKASKGQVVNMKSRLHPEEQACRVIWVGPVANGKSQYGLEFVQPAPHFWHISFPPEDWTPPSVSELAETKKK